MGRSALLQVDLGVLALALGLAGCQRPSVDGNTTAAATGADANGVAALPALPSAVPLATGAPSPSTAAPLAAALPGRVPARRARLADPRGGYAYLDRAYGQSAATDVAPPDYAFSYGDVRPYAWQAADQSREIVEPVPGGYRYYYYQPGADAPYLVRDPSYSYAYDGPALVAVYDGFGRPLPPDPGYDQALYAGRYLLRAQALYQASLRRRQAVLAADWSAHQAEIAAARARWAAQQARDSQWQAYHAEHAAEEQAYWAGERERRAAAAARFADWRARSFSGPPPVLYASAPPVPKYVPPVQRVVAPAQAPAPRYAPPQAAATTAPRFAPPPRVQPVAVAHPTAPPAVVAHQPLVVPRVGPERTDLVEPHAPSHQPAANVPHPREAQVAVSVLAQHAPAPPQAFARAVENRPAPVQSLPAFEPRHAPPPERVVVARGADVLPAEPVRHAEPPHLAPPPVREPRPEPRPAPPPHIALSAPRPPEHHAEPPRAEHHEEPHHEPDHHGGDHHDHH